MDYDGQNVRRITTSATINLSPVWSPAEDRLAYVSWRGGAPGVHILESDGRLVVAPTAGGDMNSAPDWSPDGRRIAFSFPWDEVWVMNADGTGARRLTKYGGGPAWQPVAEP